MSPSPKCIWLVVSQPSFSSVQPLLKGQLYCDVIYMDNLAYQFLPSDGDTLLSDEPQVKDRLVSIVTKFLLLRYIRLNNVLILSPESCPGPITRDQMLISA